MENKKVNDFFKCSILIKDSEYGMTYGSGIDVYDGGKHIVFPVYAGMINGELVEVITGTKLKVATISHPSSKDYSSRTYDELKKLKPGYYYIYGVFEVKKEEVAQNIIKMEDNNMVEAYKRNFASELRNQELDIAKAFENRKKQYQEDEYATSNADKILSKYLKG